MTCLQNYLNILSTMTRDKFLFGRSLINKEVHSLINKEFYELS